MERVSSDGTGVLCTATLGRPFQLGMLYDCCKDELIPGRLLWDKSTLAQHKEVETEDKCETKVILTDSINSKAKALEICDRLKLSIISGLVDVSGAGDYFNHTPVTFNQDQVTLKIKYTTKKEILKLGDIPDLNVRPKRLNSVGTHVVSGISYGNQVFFVFDKYYRDKSRNEATFGHLRELIELVPTLRNKEHMLDKLTKEHKELAEHSLSIQTFADIMPSKTPCTFEDVVQVYSGLSGLLGENGEKAVPLMAWLTPVRNDRSECYPMHKISTMQADTMQQTVFELVKANVTISDMMKTRVVQTSPALHSELNCFQGLINVCKDKLKVDLSKVLSKVRNGECEESVLDTLITKHATSPFNFKAINLYLEEKQTEITVLQRFFENVPKIEFATKPGELEAASMDPTYKNVFCFVIERPIKNTFLADMEMYLNNEKQTKSMLIEIQQQVYHTSYEYTQSLFAKTARAFIQLYQSEKDIPFIKFLIVEKNTDTSHLAAAIIEYEDGTRLEENSCFQNVETVTKPKSQNIVHVTPAFSVENEDYINQKSFMTETSMKNLHEESFVLSTCNKPDPMEQFISRKVGYVDQQKMGQDDTCTIQNSSQTQTSVQHVNDSLSEFGKSSTIHSRKDEFFGAQWKDNTDKNSSHLQSYIYDLASSKTSKHSPSNQYAFNKDNVFDEMMEYQDCMNQNFSDANMEHEYVQHESVKQKDINPVENKQNLCKEDLVLALKPSTPVISEIYHDSVTLGWDEPKDHSVTITEYDVSCKQKHSYEILNKTGTRTNVFTFPNLEPGKVYEFKVRTYAGSLVSPYSNSSKPIQTLPTSPPGKPRVRQTTNTTALLKWTRPSEVGSEVTIKSYVVWTWSSDLNEGNDWYELKRLPGNETETEVSINPLFRYNFRIIVDCGRYGTSNESQESGEYCPRAAEFDTKAPKHSIEAAMKLDLMYLLGHSPSIYQIICREIYSNHYCKLRKYELGEKPKMPIKNEKVVLLVGATGSGKSTLINGIVNYVLGVTWKDDSRFKLITEEIASGKKASQAKSQTKWITSYTIHQQSDFRVPYTLTLIDTPGFGDTSGIQRDKEIMQQIKEFFSSQGNKGIDHIDAVGFVVQSSLPRLTPTQKFIYDSVLNLFGKDITGNVFMLLTFSDGQRPPVLDGLKEAKLPFEETFFKFNNSALFASNQCEGETDEEKVATMKFDRKFWKMGATSYKHFLNHLNQIESKSLLLTNEVLKERQRLQICIEGLQIDIQYALNKMEQLEVERSILRNHEADIKKNRDFEYSVVEEVAHLIPTPPGQFTMNCPRCKKTCHYPCYLSGGNAKKKCAAMSCGSCTVCKCEWNVHENMPYRYIIIRETRKKKFANLQGRYNEALGKSSSVQQLIQTIKSDVKKHEQMVYDYVSKITSSLKRLDEIAMKRSNHSAIQYIDILIQSEKNEARPGFESRVEQLLKVREYASTQKSPKRWYQYGKWTNL